MNKGKTMKKSVIGLIIGTCMLAGSSCFAMQFSPIEKMGGMIYSQAGRHSEGGLILKNPTHNTGDYYTFRYSDNTHSYGKGIAAFGEGTDAMYVHYDMYARAPIALGGKNINNTIKWRFHLICADINQIQTDEGITLYAMYDEYGPEADYLIIGRRADGVWVKYLDTREITKRYWNWDGDGASPVVYTKLRTDEDTLVINYGNWRSREYGEFRFRWDTNAQWFGIDKVVY